jgi:hypothetical protein
MGIPGVCSLVFRAFVAAVSLSTFYSQTAVLKDDIVMSVLPLSSNQDKVMKIQGWGYLLQLTQDLYLTSKVKL